MVYGFASSSGGADHRGLGKCPELSFERFRSTLIGGCKLRTPAPIGANADAKGNGCFGAKTGSADLEQELPFSAGSGPFRGKRLTAGVEPIRSSRDGAAIRKL